MDQSMYTISTITTLARLLVDEGKVGVLVQQLVVLELWREEVILLLPSPIFLVLTINQTPSLPGAPAPPHLLPTTVLLPHLLGGLP